jgi:FkbM family methyltransferase
MMWIKGSGVNGYWLGSYEKLKQLALLKYLRAGTNFLDIGSNVGFYSILAARIVGLDGSVCSIEPVPRNVGYLRRHIALNRLSNVIILEIAICDVTGEALFNDSAEPCMCCLQNEGNRIVCTDTIDNLVTSGRIRIPDVIKIDVEGAEARVLRGMALVIEQIRPTIFIATHGVNEHQEVLKMLRLFSYDVHGLAGEDPTSTNELVALPEILDNQGDV